MSSRSVSRNNFFETRARAGSPSYLDFSDEEEDSLEQLSLPSGSADNRHPRGLVYVSAVWPSRGHVEFASPTHGGKFLVLSVSCIDELAAHCLYILHWEQDRAIFTRLSPSAAHICLHRLDNRIPAAAYEQRVLRPLLLGSRIMDNEEHGNRHEGAKTCPTLVYFPLGAIPISLMLQQCSSEGVSLPNRRNIDVLSLELLDRIYGWPGRFSFRTVQRGSVCMRKAPFIELNDEQSQAALRYREDRPAQFDTLFSPAFIIEGGPGTGKTLLAAFMANGVRAPGLQLLLAPTRRSLEVLAKTSHRVIGSKKVLYLGEHHSSYPDFTTNDAFAAYDALENELRSATTETEERELRERMSDAHEEAIATCDPQDILIATVEDVLKIVLSEEDHAIKNQVMDEVSRVVIDDCQDLTEAALNAVILAFPQAIFAFIGDEKQLLLDTDAAGNLASALASTPAIEVVKSKGNLPIVSLRSTERTTLCRHFSDVFYDGLLDSALEDDEEENDSVDTGVGIVEELPLLAALDRSVTRRNLVFLELPDNATSDVELQALEFVIRRLKREGKDESSVHVVVFSRGDQIERARSRVPGYNVNSLLAMQGSEASIVIVLATESDTEALHYRRRVNIAVSRHEEALVVIGTRQLLSTHWWNLILDRKYFHHVTY